MSAPPLLPLLPLLVFLSVSACSHAKPANRPRHFLVVAESQSGLVSLKNTGTLHCSRLCLYRHFEAIKAGGFYEGGARNTCAQQGMIVIAQHQQTLVVQPHGRWFSNDNSRSRDLTLHRAQCACLLLQGEAKGIADGDLSAATCQRALIWGRESTLFFGILRTRHLLLLRFLPQALLIQHPTTHRLKLDSSLWHRYVARSARRLVGTARNCFSDFSFRNLAFLS
jgi:hypothetical protein